ncbi:unnamed protein product [Sphagnum tenellum]
MPMSEQGISEQRKVQESESDSDSSEDFDEVTQSISLDEDASEFEDTEFEELVKEEGPQQILQLIMQNKVDELMKEQLTDDDDYADWIQWAADEERRMQSVSEAATAAEESVLLQIQQMEIADSSGDVRERITRNPKEDTRWGEICQKIRINQHLEKGMEQQLWSGHQSAFDDLKRVLVQAPVLHANADALSRNPVGQAVDDEDFHQEIPDDRVTQHGMGEAAEKVLAVRHDQHLEWFEKLRRSSGLTKHHMRGFGVNHGGNLNPHHLFMVDNVNAVDEGEETNPGVERIEVAEDEELDATVGEQKPKKGLVKNYNRRQQLELVLAAQELSGIGDSEVEAAVEEEGSEMKGYDIWQDAKCMVLLREGMLPDMIELEEGKKVKKRV